MWLLLLRRWVGRGPVGERLLPLLLRLIKTAPTFLLNHPASQRIKHFYQCLYLDKQWQVGCQGPLSSCYGRTICAVWPPRPCCTAATSVHPQMTQEHIHVDCTETNADTDARWRMKHLFSRTGTPYCRVVWGLLWSQRLEIADMDPQLWIVAGYCTKQENKASCKINLA